MGFLVEYPINVNIDNDGVILLPENILLYKQTNNIGIHQHLIYYYIENGTAEIKFVYLEENLPDLFTNNLSNGKFHLLTAGCMYIVSKYLKINMVKEWC